MGLYLYGNPTTANQFIQGTGVATSGKTKYAHLIKFRRIAGTSSNTLVFQYGTSFLGQVTFTTTGTITSKVRTNSRNTADVVVSGAALLTNYTIASKIDLAAGELKHFLNGSQVGSTISVAGQSLLSTTAKAELDGSTTDGIDHVVEELLIWNGTTGIPSDADLAGYSAGTLDPASFSVPPNNRYTPTGDGVTYVSTLTDSAGTNNMTHNGADTSGSNMPVADGGGSSYTGSIALSSVGGYAKTTSSTYCIYPVYATGLGSVALGGTYTGDTPASVLGKIDSGSYAALSSFSASGGNWSGVLGSIPYGTSLSLKATNSSAAESAVITMANFDCAVPIVVAGQSNAEGKITTNFNGNTDPLPSSYVAGARVIRASTTVAGSFAVDTPYKDYHFGHAAALVSRNLGRPVCLINVAIGSTAIASWSSSGGSSWSDATTGLTTAGVLAVACKPRVWWWQGESDAGTPYATYKAALGQLATDMVSLWGASRLTAVALPYAPSSEVARATIDAATEYTQVYCGCMAQDILYSSPDYGDGTHVQRVQEAEIVGARFSQTELWIDGKTGPIVGELLSAGGVPLVGGGLVR